MAIGKASDFQIFQDQFFGGVVEVLQQNANAFNEASRGALRLITQAHIGDYREESFIQDFSASLVTRRDTTSVSAATDTAMTQDIFRAVKLSRKLGPVAQTLDAWRKIGRDASAQSFAFGRASGPAIAADMLNTTIKALVAAIGNVAALVHDFTATGTLTHGALVTGLSKFGDAADRLVCWVMHSKQYYDLVGQAITDNIFQIGSISIMGGTTPTLGRPVIITDATDLIITGTPDAYVCLGLVAGGGVVMESEERTLVSETVTGLENLVGRIQGEMAYSLLLKGYQWDATNGGANPAAAAVATGSNWDKIAADDKSTAGIMVKTD